MLSIALTLHLLATVVWVGGMFFAHMALRPSVNALLEPPQRLPLMKRVLDHFFPWVWLAIVLLLVSGYGIFLGLWDGRAGLYVHLMQGTGWVMVGIFLVIYFIPYRRLGNSLAAGDLPAAGVQMALVRRLIGVNLVLGLVTSVLGASRAF